MDGDTGLDLVRFFGDKYFPITFDEIDDVSTGQNEYNFAWDILKDIESYISLKLKKSILGNVDRSAIVDENVMIGKGSDVEPNAVIKKNVIIGKNCSIRSGAYIRENSIIGDGCVIGNSSEVKGSIISEESQIPHFNYVGDSILGYKSHLGAGVILSNLRLDHGNVKVLYKGKFIDTGLRKFGALIGAYSEIGCNSVLNPGSIIGKKCIIYPNLNWSGILSDNSIAKNNIGVKVIKRR